MDFEELPNIVQDVIALEEQYRSSDKVTRQKIDAVAIKKFGTNWRQKARNSAKTYNYKLRKTT